MTDTGTAKAGLLSEAALPPTEIELWGLNTVLYSSGPIPVCEVREWACRAWATANFLTVVGVCQDRDPACAMPAIHRPGVLRALESLTFQDGDVLVMADEGFGEFSAVDQEWLRARVTALGKMLEVAPVAQVGATV
jgi:hypothetical protein